MRSYAIGDIHGHIELLRSAHDRIADDMARYGSAPVIHVGDLCDRGPDSRAVVDHLMNGIGAGQDWIVLKGNHDRMFHRFMRDPAELEPGLRPDLSWLHPRIGGAETLVSYGVFRPADRRAGQVHADALGLVPPEHLAFLDACPTLHQRGEAAFVHAGIRPGVALAEQRETDLLWIREPFLMDPVSHGPLIVHGHTAIAAPRHYGNRVNIDSSAAYGGPLTAVVIEGPDVFHLTEAGRVPLRP